MHVHLLEVTALFEAWKLLSARQLTHFTLGMGLTTGICDAAGLADTLVGVLRHIDPENSKHPSTESLLEKYDEIRRKKYHEITHKVSYTNTCRLRDCSPDPEQAIQEDGFFKLLNSGPEARRKILQSAYELG